MHLFKPASMLTISITWSFMVVCLAASLLHSRPSAASTQRDIEKPSWSSTSNDLESAVRATASQVVSLDKRGKTSGLELTFFEPAELLMPIEAAAEVLEAFYIGIAAHAHGPWANIAPRIWIRVTFGAVRLLMTATEGTTIPWDFVTSFALQMLKYTELGYTGTYTANYVNSAVGNGIWVSLYHCTIGPLTHPSAVGAPAKVVSCLNPNAPAWFPMRGTPTR